VANLISIFYPQQELSAGVLREKVVEQSGPQRSKVKESSRGGRKASTSGNRSPRAMVSGRIQSISRVDNPQSW
jgi:hypothetical protein